MDEPRKSGAKPAPADSETARSKAENAEVRVGWQMAGIGMTAASEVAAGVLIGWAYDLWRGHGRVGVIVGASVGIVVAMWTLIQSTLKLNRQLERSAPTAGRGKPIADEHWHDDKQPEDDDDWNQPDGRRPPTRP